LGEVGNDKTREALSAAPVPAASTALGQLRARIAALLGATPSTNWALKDGTIVTPSDARALLGQGKAVYLRTDLTVAPTTDAMRVLVDGRALPALSRTGVVVYGPSMRSERQSGDAWAALVTPDSMLSILVLRNAEPESAPQEVVVEVGPLPKKLEACDTVNRTSSFKILAPPRPPR
jgi:hypothetical protein